MTWSTLGPVAVLFGAIFTNNILLTNFLGMCSFLAISKEVKSAVGLGAAVVFVMTMVNALNWPVYYYVLVPLDITYLGFIVYIIIIAAAVQLVEMIVERVSEPLYQALGIFLPLITVNCAVFGAVLFMIIRKYTFLGGLRARGRAGVDACDRRHGGHPGEDGEGEGAEGPRGPGHHPDHHGHHGARVHGLLGHDARQLTCSPSRS
jgi:Na+-translocating ferredoxin:NAD+ oxidoreductase RnfA subunit